MFAKGDLIIYGSTGVCRVLKIGPPQGIPASDTSKLYYTLAPIYSTGTIYIPVDTKVFMRPVINRQQAKALIARIPQIQEELCCTKDPKMLAERYRASLLTHQCEDLVQLIKSIYTKNHTTGRKPGNIDQQYMKRAQELLHGELAMALDIPVEQVEDYIVRAVAEQTQE